MFRWCSPVGWGQWHHLDVGRRTRAGQECLGTSPVRELATAPSRQERQEKLCTLPSLMQVLIPWVLQSAPPVVASYPGLTSAFVACSTNAGEGQARQGLYRGRAWKNWVTCNDMTYVRTPAGPGPWNWPPGAPEVWHIPSGHSRKSRK